MGWLSTSSYMDLVFIGFVAIYYEKLCGFAGSRTDNHPTLHCIYGKGEAKVSRILRHQATSGKKVGESQK